MPAIENLTAAFNDLRSAVTLSVEKMRQLAQELASSRASAAEAALIEQIAAELHATADQLRSAIAFDPAHPGS